jgi:hypothetical protein
MVAYGEDFDVWDEFPGWGRVGSGAICSGMVSYYLEDQEALWSPLHRDGWRRHSWTSRPIKSAHFWRKPSSQDRGVLFQKYRNTLEEASARGETYAVVVDQVFDMEHYFPVERDQSLGAVLVELEAGGSTKVTRRAVPRVTFEFAFAREVSP